MTTHRYADGQNDGKRHHSNDNISFNNWQPAWKCLKCAVDHSCFLLLIIAVFWRATSKLPATRQ